LKIVEESKSNLSLTWLELDLMKAVWRQHPTTVKEVQFAIRPDRRLAYTTVMTILYRLYLKGFLRRTLLNRTHYYEPAVGFADVRDAAVGEIVDHFFQGSREQFVEFLEGHEDVEFPAKGKPEVVQLDETLL
jgi:predicted transcriptional regulator